jgi:nicotinate-nucleotide adenylyltransferase
LSRIGIYAGTFDPVHAGHIAFALQSIEAAKLDKIYFLPERRPRAKQQVEHFGHRVAMLKRAFQPHPRLKALELVDVNFSVTRTLPKLRELFAGDELVFLFGSDVVSGISQWPNAKSLLKNHEFVIGLRHDDKREDIHKTVEAWQTQPKAVTVFESYAPHVSSSKIREALRLRKPAAKGTLKSVERYSDHNWLYVSLA